MFSAGTDRPRDRRLEREQQERALRLLPGIQEIPIKLGHFIDLN